MKARDTIADAVRELAQSRSHRVPDMPPEWQEAYRSAPTFSEGAERLDTLHAQAIADAVIAAVRAMRIRDVAELIGGEVVPFAWSGGRLVHASIVVKR